MQNVIFIDYITICRDASYGGCTYNLTILDVLNGLHKVRILCQTFTGMICMPTNTFNMSRYASKMVLL